MGTCFENAMERKKSSKWGKALTHFTEMTKRPYNEKVKYSEQLVKKFIDKYKDKCAVSCSFGKDSMLVMWMALKVDPNIKVIFANTGVEYSQTKKFYPLIIRELNLNFHEAKPIKTFFQCVREYGYPDIRYTGDKKGRHAPKCCEYLKEKPLINMYKELDIGVSFQGLSADESYTRRWVIIRYGDAYKTKRRAHKEMWKVYPLAYWNIDEVWQYTKENSIPVNPAYELVDRVGCLPCTGHLRWQEQMALVNYKMYRKVQHDLGQNLIEDYTYPAIQEKV